MDTGWLIMKLTLMVGAIDLQMRMSDGAFSDDLPIEEMTRHTEATRRILAHFGQGPLMVSTDGPSLQFNREMIMSTIGYLQDKEQLEQALRPDAPSVSAGTLHPWVWGSAEQLWHSGHYREAVEAAAKAINGRVQQMTGSSLADNDLMNHAFGSSAPKAGETKLRIRGDHADGHVRGRQQALRDYAAGCFGLIRNAAVHDEEDWPEAVALERLAALSVLARAVEDTGRSTDHPGA